MQLKYNLQILHIYDTLMILIFFFCSTSVPWFGRGFIKTENWLIEQLKNQSFIILIWTTVCLRHVSGVIFTFIAMQIWFGKMFYFCIEFFCVCSPLLLSWEQTFCAHPVNLIRTFLFQYVLFDFKIYNCTRVMIYNPSVCGHPKEGGLPFESGSCLGFFQGVVLCHCCLIGDLNLYLNFKCENVKMSGKTEL